MGERQVRLPRGYKRDGSPDLRFLPRVVYRLLGKEAADGQATQLLHSDPGNDRRAKLPPLVEIDSRLSGVWRMDAEVHEHIHIAAPWMPEHVVRRLATFIARALWKIGYRLRDD